MTSDMNQWYSKSSLIKDLAQVTGNYTMDSIEVVEEAPPPRKYNNEDLSEIMERYGEIVTENVPNDVMTPDLNGITQMLRMVENETVDKSKYNVVKEPPETNSDILTISKLNPEVKEFLPGRCAQVNGVQTDLSTEIPSKELKSSHQCNNKIEKKALHHESNGIKTNGDAALPANNIKEMREQLKTKISKNANANCVRSKREKNIAIASLLKLCLQPPDGNTCKINGENKPSLKLLPPDYYEIPKIKDANAALQEESATTNKCEEIKKQNTVHDSLPEVNSTNNDCYVTIKGKFSTTNIQSICDEDIQDSVKKVENWLAGVTLENTNDKIPDTNDRSPDKISPVKDPSQNGLASPKKLNKVTGPPTLFLGPVTFKKKAVVKSSSPSVSSEATTRKTPTSTYIPSAYASELSRSYNERAKARNEIRDDIFSRLYKELDKRDEAYKKKLAEADQGTVTPVQVACENEPSNMVNIMEP